MNMPFLPEPLALKNHVWAEGTKPLVTTRTMTFNQRDFLCDCIEGILKQKTTFPVQVLIHDDASNDGTSEILKDYESRYGSLIKVYYQKTNSYSHPEKTKMRADFMAWRIGEFEATCEGDDYWDDEFKLERQARYLLENSDCGAVFTDFNILNADSGKKKIAYNKTRGRTPLQGHVFEQLLYESPYVACTSMYRLKCLEDFNYDFLKLSRFRMGDKALWLHISRKYKMAYLPFVSATYRVQSESVSNFLSVESILNFHLENVKLSEHFAKVENIEVNIRALNRKAVEATINQLLSAGYYGQLGYFWRNIDLLALGFLKLLGRMLLEKIRR